MLLTGEDGQSLPPRRDPYARHTEFDSAWCFVDDAAAFDWRHPWEPPPFDEYLIYEVQPPPLECAIAFVASSGRTYVRLQSGKPGAAWLK